jgi:hypothetical protein
LLGLALAGALIGVTYFLTVEPLGPGGVWYAQGFSYPQSSPARFTGFPPRQVMVADYAANGTILFGFGVRNATLVPVTITDLANWWNGRFILRRVSVGHEEVGSSASARPLPFTLAPGQQTILVVTAQFQNCRYWPGGGSTFFDSLPVDVTMLGVSRRMNFPLPYEIHLNGTDACP